MTRAKVRCTNMIKSEIRKVAKLADDEGFIKLHEAIWIKAIEDDIRSAKARMLVETTELLFPNVLKYPYEQRTKITKLNHIIKEQYGKQSIAALNRLLHNIDLHTDQLINAVREKIYRETLKWPNNDKSKDPEFELTFRRIRDEILQQYSEAAI